MGQSNLHIYHTTGDSTPLVFTVGSAEIPTGVPIVDGLDDLGFAVNDLGKIFTPNISNNNQQNVLVYNTASGEITYYTASEFGGGGGGGTSVDIYENDTVLVRSSVTGINFSGSGFDTITSSSTGVTVYNDNVNSQFLDNQGTITLTTTNSGVTVSGSAYFVLSGSDSTNNLKFSISSPTGVAQAKEGVWAGINFRYHDRGKNTYVQVFDTTDRPPNNAGSSVGHRVVMELKESGFYSLNLTQTGADGQLEFGMAGSASAAPGNFDLAPISQSVSPGPSTNHALVSKYTYLDVDISGTPQDVINFRGGTDGRPVPSGTVLTVKVVGTTAGGYLNTLFWDGAQNVAIDNNITGTTERIYSFVKTDNGNGKGLMLLNKLTL